jgi:hypothetical protein
MTPESRPPGPSKGKPGKDPFGPPLEEAHVREVFRRLVARSAAEQQAFVAKVNWNIVDPITELKLIAWLEQALYGTSCEFALALLDRLPHPKRARHVERFQLALPRLPREVAERLQNAFGPVLGGLPKRPAGNRALPAKPHTPKPNDHLAKHESVAAPTEPPKDAGGDELQRLKEFFDRFGGGAR